MKRNFDELLWKMKPESQERVKARSKELSQHVAVATVTEDVLSPSTDAKATSSDEVES